MASPNKIGRYEIIEELGRGGMGVVYKASDTALGRVVALKRLLAKDNKMVINRFLAEAKSIARLNHPNIIQIYDIGEDAEGLFITTEFVEGRDLYRLIKTQKRLSARLAYRIILQVCEAMQYAHSHSIIHRDIKPANILLTKEGVPKVADFGLARHETMKEYEMTGMVMGTQNYASPEQFQDSKHVDHRTDIYSIGAMFFEMLSGQKPQFMRESEIPQPFRPIILKATAADKSLRYLDLSLMIKDLQQVAKKRPASPAADTPSSVSEAAPPPSDFGADSGVAAMPTAPAGRRIETPPTIRGILGEEMILIPEGTFLFGPKGLVVRLPAFYIDKYPVTNEMYSRVDPNFRYRPEEARHPVTKITWLAANAFARKMSKRLPTEQQWEKAARGTKGLMFPWGNEFRPEYCNTVEGNIGSTTAVDAYPEGKTPFGVMDMAGNVWEWTATYLDDRKTARVLKGGAFNGESKFARCFARFAYPEQGLLPAAGFRCVQPVD
ncbi:MAG: SUMF1/EgtB/PvdO family nonheme iron enzyme [Deltaproteobacteria bacterium]|nr:SUMF1/EgtB/PvdO family nonheme iron enzyme [Deltaproteobacteria bacterium]MCB9490246.1 SUMF1/EgtB/PvdO family nonheme iron enzyme [Deltaproteobacteria bacterium]